jgi:hypothetical protein
MSTPVVFLIFNRPDTTQQVFEAIRQAQPSKLLVVADGPRRDREEEAEKCQATRDIIKTVDWDCEVMTNYSEVNLGCRRRISSGLDWVFETVDEAIILEDDCIPDPTFFQFCQELLKTYRYDNRVMHIAGNNFGIVGSNPHESYRFSRLTPIWGWATWRRAWQYFDVDMKLWPQVQASGLLGNIFQDPEELEGRVKSWTSVHAGNVDAWSFQWHFACLRQGNYSIVPNRNMVSNVGFRSDAVHTVSSTSPFASLAVEACEFPLVHPQVWIADRASDLRYFKTMHDLNFLGKLKKRVKQVIKR